jgi:hypothetical protein
MGLALDEPNEGDEKFTVEEVPVVADPFAMQIVRQFGGIDIRSSIFGPVAELRGAEKSACGH